MEVLADSVVEFRTGTASGNRECCNLSLAIVDRNGDPMTNPEIASFFEKALLSLGQLYIGFGDRPGEGKRRCDRARDHRIDPVVPIRTVPLYPETRICRHRQRVVVISSRDESYIGVARRAEMGQSSP